MKTRFLSILIGIIHTVFLPSLFWGATSQNNGHTDDLFATLSDEEYEAYEDSIKSALYPPVHTVSFNPNTLTSASSVSDFVAFSEGVNPNIPDCIDIDRTKNVGQISISSDISATGAKTYTVPIEVYPGLRGIEPKLALIYNSHQGNSIVGMGWNISGLSTIIRGGKNIYHDSKADGIRMDNTDSFWLDGIRLVRTRIATGYILYESERGNIKAKGHVSGDVMKYFEVFYPDGHKGVFGFTSSEQNGLVYPISAYSDLNGNKMTYSYTYAHSHYNIAKIYYNGASIEFKYETRPDPLHSYSGGYKVYESLLLKEIICRLAETEISSYKFEHSVQLYSSFLTKIHHSSEDKSFNPLQFYYGDGLTDYSYDQSETMLLKGYESSETKMIKAIKGKFDYKSGSEGIAVLPNFNPYWKHHRHGTAFRNTQDRFDNLFSGDENIYLYTGLTGDLVSPMPNLTTGKGFVEILCADIEGKQEESLIKINNVVSGSEDELTFTVYGYGLGGSIKHRFTRTFKFPTAYKDNDGAWSIQPKFYHAGDFDGDGKMEILAVSAHEPFGDTSKPSMCYVFDLSAGILKYSGHIFPYNVDFIGTQQTDTKAAFNNTDRLMAMDCNGDSKTDICIINENGTEIYTFDITENTYTPRKLITYTTLNKTGIADKDLLPGDFNGDGLPDFLLSPVAGEGDLWTVFFSTGNGFFIKSEFHCTQKDADEKNGFIVQDINGDGKFDLIKYNNSGLNPGFRTYLSQDDSFYYLGYTSYSSSNTIIIPTYLNTHNCFMQLLCLQKGDVKKFSFQRNLQREASLTGMINSLGVIEKNEYKHIDGYGEPSTFYIKGYDAEYPYVNLMEPISVLASTNTFVNGIQIAGNTLGYSNAVLHRQGLGFCGFEKITSVDNKGRTYIKEYDPYRFGILTKETSPKYEKSFTYDISYGDFGIKRINLIEKTEKDLLRGISSTTTCTYDSYGYPKTQTTTYSDGIIVKNSYDYISNAEVGDGYHLGFQISETINTSYNGSSFSEKTYIPAHSSRLPYILIHYKDGNQISQTTYSYDTKGNKLSESEKSYDAASSQTTSYSYDSYGRLSKITDPTGFSNSYTYDSKGRVKTLTDRRGKTTGYAYDSFGRETCITNPDGTKKEIAYQWSTGSEGTLYFISESNTGQPTKKAFYDALNRETRIGKLCFDGSETKTDRRYDFDGNMTAESLPYKGESTQFWNIYEYDKHGRLTVSKEASGKETSYTYENNSVSSTENGRTVTKEYDSQGNLISLTDPEGSMSYVFDADGQLSSVTVFDDITTTVSYDKFRRKVAVSDPSLGTFTFGYDTSGNLSSETDANGKTISYTYDVYNRLTTKTCPEFIATYTYNSYGDIATVSSDNGTSSSFSYDGFGRLEKSTENGLDGKWLRKEFSYADGNIHTVTYTSQSGLLEKETRTYANGHLKEVKSKDGTVIFSLIKENEFGQPTETSTAFLTREYSYSNYGIPTRRKVFSSEKTFQDISYEFESNKFNLLSKTDNLSNFTETYGYDTLDRLTNYGGNSVSYDIKGNILGKSEVGTFQYGLTSKPYALTEVQISGDEVPSETQSITYTSFSRPAGITEGNKTASFSYNADYDRVKMSLSVNGKETLTRHYLGGCYEYEKTSIAINERLYLLGDYYSSPVVAVKNMQIATVQDASSSVVEEPSTEMESVTGVEIGPVYKYNNLYYILRDHIGSVTGIVSCTGGSVQNLDYDAWGRLRDTSSHLAYSSDKTPSLFIGRGYSGHEHLPWFGLINMNARLYDPIMSRFLSPDPFVQMPEWSQNFNRFTYAMNNPLCYVDEDGQFFWIAVGVSAIIGGITNLAVNWNQIKAAGGGWNSFWRGAGYFLVGAVAGGAGTAMGIGVAVGFNSLMIVNAAGFSCMTTGFFSGANVGAVTGLTNGFILNTSNSLLEGHSILSSLENGLIGAAIGGISYGLTGGVVGGLKAVNAGKSFWTAKYHNRGLIQRSADLAEARIGGKGAVPGTKKHSYATNLLRRYQRRYGDQGLSFGNTAQDEITGKYCRLDVLDNTKNIIYDWKFGYPHMTPLQLNMIPQMQIYRRVFKKPTQIIKPNPL